MIKQRKSIFAMGIASILLMITSCNQLPNEIDNTKKVVPNLALKEVEQFGQFVGEWKCNVTNLQRDSTWKKTIAHWKFKYILNGHAVQDYWRHTSRLENDSISTLLGSNIRIYNPKLKKWQCMWIENKRNTMNGIWEAAMNVNNEIILKDSTNAWEIKFYNITKEHFEWKWDFRQPSGEMRTMSKIYATRKS